VGRLIAGVACSADLLDVACLRTIYLCPRRTLSLSRASDIFAARQLIGLFVDSDRHGFVAATDTQAYVN